MSYLSILSTKCPILNKEHAKVSRISASLEVLVRFCSSSNPKYIICPEYTSEKTCPKTCLIYEKGCIYKNGFKPL